MLEFKVRHIMKIMIITMCFCIPVGVGWAQDRPIPVLLYHRVGDAANALTVTSERFAADLDELKQNGYETITLKTFEDYLNGTDVKLPPKPILITFDDSYQDNYDNAFPILKKHNYKASFFIITSMIDALGGRLTSSEMLEMNHDGMSFGSHTVSHARLGRESEERVKNELLFSKKFLEDLLGIPITTIAYPQGSYTAKTIQMASESGYHIGFTVNEGVCQQQNSHFIIPRIAIFSYTGDVIEAINNL